MVNGIGMYSMKKNKTYFLEQHAIQLRTMLWHTPLKA